MFKINLSPQRRDDELSVIIEGSVITINGDELDLDDIPAGATYENGSELHEFLAGPVIKEKDGDVELTLLLPHGPEPEQYQAFPEPIIDPSDGVLDLPSNTHIEVTEEEVEGGVNVTTLTYKWRQDPDVQTVFIPNEELADGQD